MRSFKDYEDDSYNREAEGARLVNKWRHGRRYLFELSYRFGQMDLDKRWMAERKLRNYLKETDFANEQGNLCERIEWNHLYPKMDNYRDLHMHHKIVL